MPTILEPQRTGLPEGTRLNPLQELVVPVMDTHANKLVISKTASGKTVCISLCAFKHLFPKKKADKGILMYLAPMKALVEEKRRDWQEETHPYSKLNLVIITGDYVGAWEDAKTIDNADIIVITPESLASRMRNLKADKSSFLHRIKILAVDEIHTLAEEGRGGTLEAAMMEFFSEFPDVELVGLSATVPNAEGIAKWAGSLNGKETHLIKSDYRPTKLTYEFVPIPAYCKDPDRITNILQQVALNPDDQWLMGMHSKAFGRKLEKSMKSAGFECKFHNADKDHQERLATEREFRNGELRYLLATSTLYVGVNLPAKRVLGSSVRAGGKDIPAFILQQLAGRAGRPQYDTEGIATFLVPENEFEYHVNRIQNGENVYSQLRTPETLAMHFLGAMYVGRIKHHNDFYTWYERTLAQLQFPLKDFDKKVLLEGIIADMVKRGMLDEAEDKSLLLRKRGELSAQMGIDPYYLFDLCCNFRKFLTKSHQGDLELAAALGCCGPFYASYLTQYELDQIPAFIKSHVEQQGYWKSVLAYYNLIGEHEMPEFLFSMSYQMKTDIERIGVVLDRLNFEIEGWRDRDNICYVPYRVYYSATMSESYWIEKGASKSQARRLLKQDITSIDALKSRPELAGTIFSEKKLRRMGIK